MSQTPAGWFPDPSAPPGLPQLRYWDGTAWTEHRAPTAPYVPSVPTSLSAPTTPDGALLAGWWWRVLAWVVDGMVIGIPGAVITLPAQLRFQHRLQDAMLPVQRGDRVDMTRFWHVYGQGLRDLAPVQVIVLLAAIAYFVVMLRWKGASVGMLVTGLRVRLRERPGRLPWSAVVVRVLLLNGATVVPYVFLALGWWVVAGVAFLCAVGFFLLDVLWPLWDAKRQALHDKVARTNVVKVR